MCKRFKHVIYSLYDDIRKISGFEMKNTERNLSIVFIFCAGFDAFGDVLQPTKQGGMIQPTGSNKTATEAKLLATDLDTSLASLASNLSVKSSSNQIKKWVVDLSTPVSCTQTVAWKLVFLILYFYLCFFFLVL